MTTAGQSYYRKAVRRAVESIVSSLDTALDLHELAKVAAVSPFHFHRIFRGMLGETPLGMHRRLRLERAAWTLQQTSKPVTRIAFEAGYETHESFTRAFRARFAKTPREFRDGALRHRLASRAGVHFSDPATIEIDLPKLEEPASMHVRVEDHPEQRVFTIRHTGPYNQIHTAFARLGEMAGQHGLFAVARGMVALYHDDPELVAPADLRSDAGLLVGDDAKCPEGLQQAHIGAGRFACAIHEGPYTTLGDTWARLMGHWLPNSTHRLGNGLSYELYLNNPVDTPEPALKTELRVPLAELRTT